MLNPPTLAQGLYGLGMKHHRCISNVPHRAVVMILSTPNRKIPSSQFPLDVKSLNEDIFVNPMRNRQNGWVPMEGVMAALTSLREVCTKGPPRIAENFRIPGYGHR